jgi:hypothetical protein
MSEDEDTKFLVHLRGMKLPEDVTKRIESQIQQIVKDEIAKLDIGPKDRGLGLEDDKEQRSRLWGEKLGWHTAGFTPNTTAWVIPESLKSKFGKDFFKD